ncbi:MAG: hypothetical protein ABI556_06490 [Gemmatimonadales bacterium]
MWKWLGGCLLLIIVLIAGAMIWGYRTMKESLAPDGSASVTIAGPPERVFASIAHGDSAATWMAQGSTILPSRHGPLVSGDSLRIETNTRLPAPQQTIIWRVKEVVPNQLRVLELLSDSTHGVLATRRDSISAVGDSTRVVTKILSSMLDSVTRGQNKSKAKSADGLTAMAPEFLMAMFRMQSKLELTRLKGRIEGVKRPIR